MMKNLFASLVVTLLAAGASAQGFPSKPGKRNVP